VSTKGKLKDDLMGISSLAVLLQAVVLQYIIAAKLQLRSAMGAVSLQ
jgi:hypothetical protein